MTTPNPPLPTPLPTPKDPKSPSSSTQTPLKKTPDNNRASHPASHPSSTLMPSSQKPSPGMGYPPGRPIQELPKPRIRRKKRSRYDSPSCCCSSPCICYYSFCTLFLLIILVALFGLVFYVWYQPKLPIFELVSVQFPRFNITAVPGDISGPHFLNSTTIVEMKVKNRNEKITFHYGTTQGGITVLGNEISLGSMEIPGFTQWKSNITVLRFEMEKDHVLLSETDADKLKRQYKSNNIAISTEFRTKVGVTFNSWHWKVGKVPVRFLCKNVILSNGKGSSAENPKCSLIVFRLSLLISAPVGGPGWYMPQK